MSDTISVGDIVSHCSFNYFDCKIIEIRKGSSDRRFVLECLSTDNHLKVYQLVNNVDDLRRLNKSVPAPQSSVPIGFKFFINEHLIFLDSTTATSATKNYCSFYLSHKNIENDVHEDMYEKLCKILS